MQRKPALSPTLSHRMGEGDYDYDYDYDYEHEHE